VRSVLWVVTVAGCGRIGFDDSLATRTDATSADAPAVDAAIDAAIDAPTFTVTIESAQHHLGDTPGGTPSAPEGIVLTRPFDVPVLCSSAILELYFVPPWGPNVAQPPIVQINGTALGSVIPFFQNCGGDCDDFSGGDVHVTLQATAALVLGQNSFRIACGVPGDDIFFRDVSLSCVP